MKKIAALVIVLAFVLVTANVSAMDKNLDRSGAILHDAVQSVPGNPEVVSHFNSAIDLHKLKKNELGYWSPSSNKYITTDKYAYLFCNVYKMGKLKPKRRWIAVTTDALNKALSLSHKFGGGVAYYQLSFDGKYIVFKAFPFDTLHAIATGEKIVDVKE